MNHKLFPLFSVMLLLFSSCGNDDNNAIEFKTISAEKTVNLSNEELSPKCSVSLKMAYATEANGHRAEVLNNYVMERLFEMQDVSMETAANQFIEQYTNTYIKNMLPLYNQDRADTTKRSWYEYHYVITTETQPGSKGKTVYLATIDYYEGGAHGINQLITMNFNTETGQHITLADIFVPGFEHQLNEILLEALKEKVDTPNMADLKEKGYLYSMDMFPSENFILSDNTITFIYNPYEIAPYDLGAIQLTIPYRDLKKILKNSFEY